MHQVVGWDRAFSKKLYKPDHPTEQSAAGVWLTGGGHPLGDDVVGEQGVSGAGGRQHERKQHVQHGAENGQNRIISKHSNSIGTLRGVSEGGLTWQTKGKSMM